MCSHSREWVLQNQFKLPFVSGAHSTGMTPAVKSLHTCRHKRLMLGDLPVNSCFIFAYIVPSLWKGYSSDLALHILYTRLGDFWETEQRMVQMRQSLLWVNTKKVYTSHNVTQSVTLGRTLYPDKPHPLFVKIKTKQKKTTGKTFVCVNLNLNYLCHLAALPVIWLCHSACRPDVSSDCVFVNVVLRSGYAAKV